MAFSLDTLESKLHSLYFISTLKSSSHSHLPHNRTTSAHTETAHRQATITKHETGEAKIPPTTKTTTVTIKQTTRLPMSSASSDLGIGQAHISICAPHLPTSSSITTIAPRTSSSSSSSEFYTNPSKVSLTMTVNTDLGSPPTAQPQITERRFFELPTATLVGVAIAGSVAVNLLILVLWLLLRQKCSRKPAGVGAAKEELGAVDSTEKERPDLPADTMKITEEGDSGLLAPQGISTHSPLSTHQPMPMPMSSFWSAASSRWTLERARSNDQAHLDEMEDPRHFTTFSLNTPVNPRPFSPTLADLPSDPENQENAARFVLSPDDEQDNRTVTAPTPLRHSRGESLTDPRSPRRLSIPVFMENYSSPNISRYLPPQTQSTIITSNERNSYDPKPESMLQGRESSRRVVESEVGFGSVAASMTSLASLPSESSEVMTPRRHWTFVDIHGPSSHTTSPQDFEGVLNRLSGAGSSQTLAGEASTGQFLVGSSSSRVPYSEPSGTDSFLHTDYGASTCSRFS